ncbi:MAG TPA: ABC transporter substrate-binding protein [Candidatus Limnocylindria bacterium]|nr:ABC transporter substrate-binding protein [Candidatus Limnocylindria bacterium]
MPPPLLGRRALLAAGLGPAVAACARPAAQSGPAGAEARSAPAVDRVRFAWADVGVPTPFRVSTAGPGGPVLLTLLYDTLTWKDDRGIIPWLASRWEVSPDGRDYTFILVPGARWQDGQPVTTQDVAFTFDYYARHPYRWMSTAMVEAAEALDAAHVRVRLKEAYAPFLEEVAGVAPILPSHVWAQVDDPSTFDGAGASLGSGPFRLAEYRAAEGAYRLSANPDYFAGRVVVGELQQLNTAAETRVLAVRQGELELAHTTDGSVGAALKGDSRVKVLETEPLSVVRLAVNTARPPLDRREVREAIAYALDRARIAAVVTKAPPVVGRDGVVPPGSPWFDPQAASRAFDPARSRALLGGQRHTLELIADPMDREPELMQPMLEAVGISLVVRRADAKTRTQLLREGRFQLGQLQHIGVGGDPDFLRRWYTGQETNDFAQGFTFVDERYAQLAAAQAAALDPARRRELVWRMQTILAEQLPTIVLYYRRFYWVYDSARYRPMNTWGGLMNGIPLVQNKLTFLAR